MTRPERRIGSAATRWMVLLGTIFFCGAVLVACSQSPVNRPPATGEPTLLLRYECVPGPVGMPPDRSCFGPSFSLYSDGRVIYRDASRLDNADRPTLAASRNSAPSAAPAHSDAGRLSPTPSPPEPPARRTPIPGVDIDPVAIEAPYQAAVLTPTAVEQLMARAHVLRELASIDRSSATRGDRWYFDEYAISIDDRVVSIPDAGFGASADQAARLNDLGLLLSSYRPAPIDVVSSPEPFEPSPACAWLRRTVDLPSAPWPWSDLSPDEFDTVNSPGGEPRRLSPEQADQVAPGIAGGIINLNIEGPSPNSSFVMTARPLMPDEECSRQLDLTLHG
jgi:hypothetical protein